MKAAVSNYRRSRHAMKGNQAILIAEGIKTRTDAEKLKGKEVVYVTSGRKKIKGKIAAAHGNKGAFRAIFERGLPGQAVGTMVEISI
ncbi:MAG TPA: 50S ribosomal protein L35ae [Candidatus Norongarragalinales archaeon]|nr:50S ribosomal protein L35ae [Candidatus Norongarragalinales archaeon]